MTAGYEPAEIDASGGIVMPGMMWEWSATPEFRNFVSRRFTAGDDMLGFQMAFDAPPTTMASGSCTRAGS
jgi:hypothetical protein